jgi:hypothetical protein
VVVVVRKETGNAMRICKPATLIERNTQRAVPCTYKHCPALIRIPFEKKLYQFLSISLALEPGIDGNILYLENIFCFAGDNAGCLYAAVIGKDEHFAAFQVTVNHGFLLIGQQQKVEVSLFVVDNGLYAYHIVLYIYAAKITFTGVQPNKIPGDIVDFDKLPIDDYE